MRIFLVGFMGSGKTTIGKRLALQIGFDFVDTDHLVEQKFGKSVGQIFAESGETFFREAEHQVIQEVLQRDFVVIATGGGLPCYSDNMDTMLKYGKVVYLKTSPKTLAYRLSHSRTERPLIKNMLPDELNRYIEHKLTEREPFYSRAPIVIHTEHFSMDQLKQDLQLMKR